jgi:CRISPR-associated protein (TIGR02584 family)
LSDRITVKHKKNILLAITGLSPQVVTETLYGIKHAKMEWPDEIQVITTKKGKEQARLGLLETSNGKKTVLEQFCIDYHMPLPILTLDTILVVPDAKGADVDDARTFEDQKALADFIVGHVGKLCADDSVRLHASLAGGRKTMTFFLGYAMTLFSRIDDRLSHVLVDEVFEGNRQFYYPTPYTHVIDGRGDNEQLDAKDANVMLAEIPFIRQRSQLHKNVLKSMENESYLDLVMFQNAVNELHKVKLELDLKNRSITVLGKTVNFSDHIMELAFYSMIARQVKEFGHSSLLKPGKDEYAKTLSNLFLQEMECIADIDVVDQSADIEGNNLSEYNDAYLKRAIALEECDLVKAKTGQAARAVNDKELIPETYEELQGGMSNSFFGDKLTSLKSKLETHFPSDFVHLILPGQVYRRDDLTKLRDYSTKNQKSTPYGLWILKDNLSINLMIKRL